MGSQAAHGRRDTIFAPATGLGRAAVSIVRLSGPSCNRVVEALTGGPPPPERLAALHTLRDPVGGEALDRALGDRVGIVRYGQATVPMDESRASCAIDISGRGLCAFEGTLPPGAIGNFDHELTEEFFRALAANAKLTLHVTIEVGTNAHHMIEAAFKAVARALRAAVAIDPTESGVPSTKGTLV